MFERLHHQRIEQVLLTLDGDLLRANHCLFGGGTVMALRHGEYRESVDVDFLVSDLAGYRHLRQLLTQAGGIAKAGLQGYDNHDPRAWLAKVTRYRARANAAQANSFEAFPFLVSGVLLALHVQALMAG